MLELTRKKDGGLSATPEMEDLIDFLSRQVDQLRDENLTLENRFSLLLSANMIAGELASKFHSLLHFAERQN